MKKLFVICLAVSAIFSCKRAETGFSQEERKLIHSTDSTMRVLTIEDPADLQTLRAVSRDFSAEACKR